MAWDHSWWNWWNWLTWLIKQRSKSPSCLCIVDTVDTKGLAILLLPPLPNLFRHKLDYTHAVYRYIVAGISVICHGLTGTHCSRNFLYWPYIHKHPSRRRPFCQPTSYINAAHKPALLWLIESNLESVRPATATGFRAPAPLYKKMYINNLTEMRFLLFSFRWISAGNNIGLHY